MENSAKTMEKITALAKARGFVYPGSEIYGGLANTWDYGNLGVELKNNVKAAWWRKFIQESPYNVGVDCAILMNPQTWEASGHLGGFSDPLMDCKECHERHRADKIIEEWAFDNKIELGSSVDGWSNEEMENFIKEKGIACPSCGAHDFTEIRQFNLMFKTFQGVTEDAKNTVYLRPETAQGIFTNYKNVVDTIYPDLPFGIAQQGKAFRNEISPRDFIFRSREFNQMEIEYFVDPETWEENFDKLLAGCHDFLENKMGLRKENIHELDVPAEDRAHYSKRTIDIEFDYPIGCEELMGIAYRTDFDLSNIQRESGKNMEYIVKGGGKRFIPHVIEPSMGVERLVMAVLCTAYSEDEVNSEKRTLLKLSEDLAPYRFCVSPLLKNKPELVAKAKDVYDALRKKYGNVTWDDSGNIGKRYRKQDEIGTPKCVVIDFDTLEDDTVTVRDRDTTEQVRVKIAEL